MITNSNFKKINSSICLIFFTLLYLRFTDLYFCLIRKGLVCGLVGFGRSRIHLVKRLGSSIRSSGMGQDEILGLHSD